MFLLKNDLHFFLPKGTSHGCCCFPQTYLFLAEYKWSLSSTSTFSSVLWTISVTPFHLSSKVSTAPAGSQGPKGSLQDNSDKRPQSLISRGLNMLNCAGSPLPLPSVHPQKSAHWSMESKHQNTHSPSF